MIQGRKLSLKKTPKLHGNHKIAEFEQNRASITPRGAEDLHILRQNGCDFRDQHPKNS